MSATVDALPPPEARAEAQVAAAIERLREDMPQNFILLYVTGTGAENEKVTTIAHCSLGAAKLLLGEGLRNVTEAYAVSQANSAGGS